MYVAGVDLPVADDIKVLGVVLDRRLTFHKHVSVVARSCNYHAQAIRHIRHLLTMELAQILACPGSTTAMLYSTALQATASRSCSDHRTIASRFNIYSQLVISAIRIADINNSNCLYH